MKLVTTLCLLLLSSFVTSFYTKKATTRPFLSRNGPLFSEKQRKYPISRHYYEDYVRRLNSRNVTVRSRAMFDDYPRNMQNVNTNMTDEEEHNQDQKHSGVGLRIIIGRNGRAQIMAENTPRLPNIPDDVEKQMREHEQKLLNELAANGQDDDSEEEDIWQRFRGYRRGSGHMGSGSDGKKKKSENFEVVQDSPISFKDVGGYAKVKEELEQCVDILKNYEKYTKYNVRIPKGIIFEGPPGNGKTMIAKALAGEAGIPFIAVSGAEFQEKYVGVGSARVRELFKLANANAPVIVFIDELDAIGKKRSGDGESSTGERDNTLNELLVSMDGFRNSTGVFIVGATNRIDLLDPALMRPGRIDKKVHIGNPDPETRAAIINIHSAGKPMDIRIKMRDLVEITTGLSGAQIENVLNEAMLLAIRENRDIIVHSDISDVVNKMMVGWQPTKHSFTSDIIDHIAIHEMGHVVIGMISKNHANVSKVMINLNAPKSPGYTVFEQMESPIYTRELLYEHLMILLGGRVAEEIFYNTSVTTGAINDFEEALKLAERMITFYGMGSETIYPSNSEKYKALIDEEVFLLIQEAYRGTKDAMTIMKKYVEDGAVELKNRGVLHAADLQKMMDEHQEYLDAKEMGVDYVVYLDENDPNLP